MSPSPVLRKHLQGQTLVCVWGGPQADGVRGQAWGLTGTAGLPAAVTGGLVFVLGAVPDSPHPQRAQLPGVGDGGPSSVSAPCALLPVIEVRLSVSLWLLRLPHLLSLSPRKKEEKAREPPPHRTSRHAPFPFLGGCSPSPGLSQGGLASCPLPSLLCPPRAVGRARKTHRGREAGALGFVHLPSAGARHCPPPAAGCAHSCCSTLSFQA